MGQEFAVEINDLSKKFKIYDSMKDRIKEAMDPRRKKYHSDFWALQDINLKIQKGQTLGLIGKNGSGKSTLLQLICSILEPTKGDVKVNGRISALLELGAGFNPMFTGRENATFSAKLMGYSKEKIEELLPKVKEFSGIGDFFERPVRTYSSGMFVRLAFATSIHVDPDILIIDEALGVGDVQFQQKCYAKFRDLQEQGKTIIFVTHSIDLITRHCDQAVLLNKGRVETIGDPREVVNKYLKLMQGKENVFRPPSLKEGNNDDASILKSLSCKEHFFDISKDEDRCHLHPYYNKNEVRFGNQESKIVDFLFLCDGVENPTAIQSGKKLDLYVKVKFYKESYTPILGFGFKTVDGVNIYGTNCRFQNKVISPAKSGEVRIFKFNMNLNLASGDYFMNIGFTELDINQEEQSKDRRIDVASVKVIEANECTGVIDLFSTIEEVSINEKGHHEQYQ